MVTSCLVSVTPATGYSGQNRRVQTLPVLVPIDMQQGFDLVTEKGAAWPPRWNTQLDVNGARLLAHWRERQWPVVHVRHDSVEPQSTLRVGQVGNDFRPGFEPQGDEQIVSKSVNAAFIGTDLDLRLRRLGASEIVVFGITTDQCVSTSVRVGANLGWKCTLVEDACDCFELPLPQSGYLSARDIHRAHVATLAFEFCSVTTTSELVRHD